MAEGMTVTLPPALEAELRQRIAEHDLASVADAIVREAAPCYAMVVAEPDRYATVGNTRWGGEPDLPPDWAWPCDADGAYSNFVAQINFAEIAPMGASLGLPPSGILYLFVYYMGSAAELVELNAHFFDGDLSTLRRHTTPDTLTDEYLVDLEPWRMKAVPAISLPYYRKSFRAIFDAAPLTPDGRDGESRSYDLESALRYENQIGQLLGYANPGDVRENLYRQLYLVKTRRGHLAYRDYWDSMEEYEAYIEYWRERGDMDLVANYEAMRDDVTQLMRDRDEIARGVAEWQLLLRMDSNHHMGMEINDADPMYVFTRSEDLRKRDFSNLHGMVTQG